MRTKNLQNIAGFTLLELLMVISILAVITAIGSGYYRNYARNIEFDAAAKTMMFALKKAQAKAMAGEGTMKWGIHAVNGAEDYYEIFSTPTNYADSSKTISETTYVSSLLAFSDPSEGNSTDIIFDKINGAASAASVVFSFEGSTKTITVTAAGNIYSL